MLSKEGRKLKDLLSNNVRENSVCDSERENEKSMSGWNCSLKQHLKNT